MIFDDDNFTQASYNSSEGRKRVGFLRRFILRPGLQTVKWALHFIFPAAYQADSNVANGINCPICGLTAKKFHYGGYIEGNGVGAGLCKNSMCPDCRSLERHRLLYFVLKEHKKQFPSFAASPAILHFAPERCLTDVIDKAFPTATYTTADISDGKAMVTVDIQNMPFDDESFDLIFCNHVLEHVYDDRKAMSELCRVLKPFGRAFLTVPFDPKNKKTYEDPSITSPLSRRFHFGQKDHVRYYGMDFSDRLKDAGLTVELFKASDLGHDIVSKYALIKEDIVWIGSKVIFCG